MFEQAWKVAIEDEGYQSIASLLSEAYHPSLLLRPQISVFIFSFLNIFFVDSGYLSESETSPLRVLFHKILKQGESIMGVVNLLVAMCCPVWFDATKGTKVIIKEK